MEPRNELGLGDDVFHLFDVGIRLRLTRGETVDDAINLGFMLGSERASNLERPVTVFDLELALSGLCWWPLKPPPSPDYEQIARETRWQLLTGLYRLGPPYATAGWASSIQGPGGQLIDVLLTAPTDAFMEYFLERGEGTGFLY